jgi:hypothetical protein
MCKVRPDEFWDLTPAEINLMLEEETEARKQDIIKIADLKSAIFNSAYGPYLKEGTQYPYHINHFLPNDMFPKPEKKQISITEKNKRWSAAGHAMMDEVEKINREAKRGRR